MRPGKVIVQTFQPDATPFAYAIRHDVAGYLAHELARREELGYPPFSHLVALVVSGPDPGDVNRALQELRGALETPSARLLGPAPLLRLRGRHRATAAGEDRLTACVRQPCRGRARTCRAGHAAGRTERGGGRGSAVALAAPAEADMSVSANCGRSRGAVHPGDHVFQTEEEECGRSFSCWCSQRRSCSLLRRSRRRHTVALGTGIRAKGPGARGAPVGRATHSPSRLPDPRRL